MKQEKRVFLKKMKGKKAQCFYQISFIYEPHGDFMSRATHTDSDNVLLNSGLISSGDITLRSNMYRVVTYLALLKHHCSNDCFTSMAHGSNPGHSMILNDWAMEGSEVSSWFLPECSKSSKVRVLNSTWTFLAFDGLYEASGLQMFPAVIRTMKIDGKWLPTCVQWQSLECQTSG